MSTQPHVEDFGVAAVGLGAAGVDVDAIAAAVVKKLLSGTGIVTSTDGKVIPDDLGLPADLKLAAPYQNYIAWGARAGVVWALRDPQVLLVIAVALTAMAKAGDDPKVQIAAAKAAIDKLKK